MRPVTAPVRASVALLMIDTQVEILDGQLCKGSRLVPGEDASRRWSSRTTDKGRRGEQVARPLGLASRSFHDLHRVEVPLQVHRRANKWAPFQAIFGSTPQRSTSRFVWRTSAVAGARAVGLEDDCASAHVKVTWVADPVILASARRHGVTDNAMLHVYRNPIRVFDLDDLTMLIGPDESVTLLEIGVAHAEGVDFIVHAMIASPNFLE